jgi:thiamine biosynthesis lipoprotein
VREREHRRRARWPDITREGTTIATDRALLIDVGAAGKGLLVDLVADALIAAGNSSIVVDAGGDLLHRGDEPIRVGLEHPHDPSRVIGTVDLHNRALCASAINRRSWAPGLHHVIDARTGEPAQGIVATWVTADSAALADGLATALFFSEPDRLQPAYRFAFVRMSADRVETSADFTGEIFT